MAGPPCRSFFRRGGGTGKTLPRPSDGRGIKGEGVPCSGSGGEFSENTFRALNPRTSAHPLLPLLLDRTARGASGNTKGNLGWGAESIFPQGFTSNCE